MGFFDSLRRALGGDSGKGASDERLGRVWGLGDTDDQHAASADAFQGGEYDRKNWRKKLKRILGDLPASRGDWAELMSEAHALGFAHDELANWCRDEFTLLVRRIVADRVVTEAEHRKLDVARDLLGIPDAEAESILKAVVEDAEHFFGKSVEGA
jgi:hypothetical protein